MQIYSILEVWSERSSDASTNKGPGRLQSKAIIHGSTEYILIHNGITKGGDFTEELLFENRIQGKSKYILKGYRRLFNAL